MMEQTGETKRRNETIAEAFARIEASLPTTGDAEAVLAHVLRELQEAFAIPFVWLSLIDRPETEAWRPALMQSPFLGPRLNRIDATAFTEVAGKGLAPILANSDLKPFYRLLPQSNRYFIKSIAVVPLMPRGLAVGSLNFGDSSPARYHPELGTSLLTRLAAAVSRRLEGALPSDAGWKPTSIIGASASGARGETQKP
ncbi:MAG: DUF484 family protein [Pseudomonadota bacterium]|nr:DUF484 family protein [Pseudomonadota bacterium]